MKNIFKKNRPVDPPNLPPPPPPRMSVIDLEEFFVVLSCLLFAVIISLYHISREGFLGISAARWSIVWVICENALLLILSIIAGMYYLGFIRKIFRWIFVPYIIVKLIYQFSCFAGVYVFSAGTWQVIWSFICVAVILAGIVLCINKFRSYGS